MLLVFLQKASKTTVATSRRSVVAGTVLSPRSPASSVNRLVVTITLLFILMSCPGTISSIFYSELVTTQAGRLVIILLDSLEFSYHGLSFVILMMTNKKFALEFRALLPCRKPSSTLSKLIDTSPNPFQAAVDIAMQL